jgi:hypothetical protein
MFEYDELASNAVKILDKYNFEKEILQCRKAKWTSPYDIREHIGFENEGEVENALEDLSLDEIKTLIRQDALNGISVSCSCHFADEQIGERIKWYDDIDINQRNCPDSAWDKYFKQPLGE